MINNEEKTCIMGRNYVMIMTKSLAPEWLLLHNRYKIFNYFSQSKGKNDMTGHINMVWLCSCLSIQHSSLLCWYCDYGGGGGAGGSS